MGVSRRRFLAASATGAITLSAAGPVQAEDDTPCCGDTQGRRTPSEPDEDPTDPVITERYGKLDLSSEFPCWEWPLPPFSKDTVIEYEIRPENSGNTPDVIVANDTGLSKYRTQIEDIPIVSTRTVDLGWIGSIPIVEKVYTENLNIESIGKKMQQRHDWTMESVVDMAACHNEPQATQKSHSVPSGNYNLVVDWTDDVLSAPTTDETTVEVSIRARHETVGEETEAVQDEAISFYTGFPADESPLVDTMVSVAEAICDQVPPQAEDFSVTEFQEAAPRAEQAVAVTRAVFDILKDKLGYNPVFIEDLLEGATTWTRWARSVLPVVNSLEHVIDDACEVAQDAPETMTADVENLMLSLGILVVDLLMAKFGVASRIASFAVRRAHTYLLGIVREVLGLKTYLVLLRELYTLTTSGLAEALGIIKDLTRDIQQEYQDHEFIPKKEADAVDSMGETQLGSLDLDWDMDLGPLDLDPTC
ncbi:hypothetical protein HT576_08805 [Haloterrigena sp. SYSU A121-1]|uniref:Uncharacterized protein n=1 Tax=Haloterrigena gelatinilytica TaxID=2741724 RepID=A0A8J8GMF5_9EURY|nr:hypothetical protein [Haloterrigena gelatinilytica]NUB91119.1 hypothetical protein [Haloterrigena gelatinilytica]